MNSPRASLKLLLLFASLRFSRRLGCRRYLQSHESSTFGLTAPAFLLRSVDEKIGYPPHAVDDSKPKLRKGVRVWLSDGSRFLAIWTGTKWCSSKGELAPVKWELEERKTKTKKLRQKPQDSEDAA